MVQVHVPDTQHNIPEMRTVIRRDWCQSRKSRSRVVEVRCWVLVLKHIVVCGWESPSIAECVSVYVCDSSRENEGVCKNGRVKGNQSSWHPLSSNWPDSNGQRGFVRRAKRVQLSRRGFSLSRTVHSNYNNYNNNNNHINKGFPRSDFEERKKKRFGEWEGGIVWRKKRKKEKKREVY